MGIVPTDRTAMTPEESTAWQKVSESMKYEGDHYEAAVSWREERLRHGPLAEKRLKSTEQRLERKKSRGSQSISESYWPILREEVFSSSVIR